MENYTDPGLEQKNPDLNARQVSLGQYQDEKDDRLAPLELNPREQESADTTRTVRLITALGLDTPLDNFATDSSVQINDWMPEQDGSFIIHVTAPEGEKIPAHAAKISRLDRSGFVRDAEDNELGYFLKDNGLFGRFDELFASALLSVKVKRQELKQNHQVEQQSRTMTPPPLRWLV